MIRYLIDTNILSEPLKPQPNSGVMAQLELYTEDIAMFSDRLTVPIDRFCGSNH